MLFWGATGLVFRFLKILFGHPDPLVGDLTGNRESILRLHDEARAMGASLLVMPEMAITGYAPRDLLLRDGFVAAAEASLTQLASVTLDGPPILVGTPRAVPGPRGLRNAVALLRKGVIESFHDKWLLPGYDVFDEDRWFDSGDEVLHFDLEGKSVAVLCCEDLWHGADAGVPGYVHDPLSKVDAELILSVSASPFVSGKARAQQDRLRQVAQRTKATVGVLNQFGAHDELLFDGRVMVAEPNGSLTHLNAGWQPGMTVLDWDNQESHAEPDPLDELVHALACGISGYVRKTGHESVVLGLSGGLDSALVATLAAIALGPEAVHGICMPSRYSSSGSLDDARDLATRLGMVHLHEIGIEPIHEALRQSLQPALGEVAGVTDENLQARARGVLVMGLANAQGLLPLATGNKSELAVGYSTLYGDMCGALLPLGDVFKSKCYELAVHINRHPQRFGFDEPPLPESTITKPPSAELRPDQQDADSLPTYDRLDRVLEAWIEQGVAEDALPEPDLVGEILPMVQRSEFKRRQAPVVLKVSPKAFGPGRHIPVVARTRD